MSEPGRHLRRPALLELDLGTGIGDVTDKNEVPLELDLPDSGEEAALELVPIGEVFDFGETQPHNTDVSEIDPSGE